MPVTGTAAPSPARSTSSRTWERTPPSRSSTPSRRSAAASSGEHVEALHVDVVLVDLQHDDVRRRVGMRDERDDALPHAELTSA